MSILPICYGARYYFEGFVMGVIATLLFFASVYFTFKYFKSEITKKHMEENQNE